MPVPLTNESFEDYVAARWSRLVRSAVLMGADLHSAEDAVQTTLTKCFLGWDKVLKARDADAYVHRVLINTITDSRRRRWSGEHPTAGVPESASADHIADVDEHRALIEALRSLPMAQRLVIVLRFYADLTEAQTASALGVPVGTVKSRTARALASLSEHPTIAAEEGR